MKKVWITLSVLFFALGSAVFLTLQPPPIAQPFNPLAQLIDNKTQGFATVEPGWQYDFPEDSGAHSDYRMDVWYFSGYLSDTQDRSFGFQMTFFRFALEPEKKADESAWTSREIYRAHLAITDVGGKQFHSAERFGRAGLGAGVSNSPIQVWLDDWEMRIPDEIQSQFQLRAATKEVTLVLNLENIKQAITNVATGAAKPLFHGYWLPRLRVSGTLTLDAYTVTVKGLASLTHVWGGISLFRGQLALNRFVLQLDDNREILLLQLRRRDGSGDPITTGLLIEADGTMHRLSRKELSLSVLGYWQSSLDGVRYPTRWRLQIMADDLQLDLVPMLENQELNLSQRYWAGLVRLSGNSAGQVLSGTGQVELTAYAPDPTLQ